MFNLNDTCGYCDFNMSFSNVAEQNVLALGEKSAPLWSLGLHNNISNCNICLAKYICNGNKIMIFYVNSINTLPLFWQRSDYA